MIFFDHCFTDDPKHSFYKRLGRLGFRLDPHQVEHPGKSFCRFLIFEAKGVPGRKYQYLEFIDQRAKKKKWTAPGLLLGYSKDMEKFEKRLSPELDVEYYHKNYKWKENSKDRLPGWNFLTFKNLGFRTLNSYFIQYEPNPYFKREEVRKHPNGVHSIVALELNLNGKGRKFFSSILERKLPESIKLGNAIFYFKESERTNIGRVVLKSKDIGKLIRKYKVDEEIQWRGQRAALIKNPANTWDIVII